MIRRPPRSTLFPYTTLFRSIARRFKAAGADMIDCSSGQVSPDQKPVYGRMYQTPFADRVRNEAGIPTDRKSTRLNSSHTVISYAVFCLKKKIKHMRTSDAST